VPIRGFAFRFVDRFAFQTLNGLEHLAASPANSAATAPQAGKNRLCSTPGIRCQRAVSSSSG
jgi:hypothetical protein